MMARREVLETVEESTGQAGRVEVKASAAGLDVGEKNLQKSWVKAGDVRVQLKNERYEIGEELKERMLSAWR